MSQKNSHPVEMERRMDLSSLFCLVARHGPAVAMAVFALVLVLVVIVIYRRDRRRRRRRKATPLAASGVRSPVRTHMEPEESRSTSLSTDVNEDPSVTKDHADLAPSVLQIRHRRAPAEGSVRDQYTAEAYVTRTTLNLRGDSLATTDTDVEKLVCHQRVPVPKDFEEEKCLQPTLVESEAHKEEKKMSQKECHEDEKTALEDVSNENNSEEEKRHVSASNSSVSLKPTLPSDVFSDKHYSDVTTSLSHHSDCAEIEENTLCPIESISLTAEKGQEKNVGNEVVQESPSYRMNHQQEHCPSPQQPKSDKSIASNYSVEQDPTIEVPEEVVNEDHLNKHLDGAQQPKIEQETEFELFHGVEPPTEDERCINTSEVKAEVADEYNLKKHTDSESEAHLLHGDEPSQEESVECSDNVMMSTQNNDLITSEVAEQNQAIAQMKGLVAEVDQQLEEVLEVSTEIISPMDDEQNGQPIDIVEMVVDEIHVNAPKCHEFDSNLQQIEKDLTTSPREEIAAMLSEEYPEEDTCGQTMEVMADVDQNKHTDVQSYTCLLQIDERQQNDGVKCSDNTPISDHNEPLTSEEIVTQDTTVQTESHITEVDRQLEEVIGVSTEISPMDDEQNGQPIEIVEMVVDEIHVNAPKFHEFDSNLQQIEKDLTISPREEIAAMFSEEYPEEETCGQTVEVMADVDQNKYTDVQSYTCLLQNESAKCSDNTTISDHNEPQTSEEIVQQDTMVQTESRITAVDQQLEEVIGVSTEIISPMDDEKNGQPIEIVEMVVDEIHVNAPKCHEFDSNLQQIDKDLTTSPREEIAATLGEEYPEEETCGQAMEVMADVDQNKHTDVQSYTCLLQIDERQQNDGKCSDNTAISDHDEPHTSEEIVTQDTMVQTESHITEVDERQLEGAIGVSTERVPNMDIIGQPSEIIGEVVTETHQNDLNDFDTKEQQNEQELQTSPQEDVTITLGEEVYVESVCTEKLDSDFNTSSNKPVQLKEVIRDTQAEIPITDDLSKITPDDVQQSQLKEQETPILELEPSLHACELMKSIDVNVNVLESSSSINEQPESSTEANICEEAPLFSSLTSVEPLDSSQAKEKDQILTGTTFSLDTTEAESITTERNIGKNSFAALTLSDLTLSLSCCEGESGISSMAVSPDFQHSIDDLNAAPQSVLLPETVCSEQSAGQVEVQNGLFADNAPVSLIQKDIEDLTFESCTLQPNFEDKQPALDASFSVNEDMCGNEIENSYFGALDEEIGQIAEGFTNATHGMDKMTGTKSSEEAEVKKGTTEMEQDNEKTEINIMEATMDNNEWITDGNYQVLPWMNASDTSYNNTSTKNSHHSNEEKHLNYSKVTCGDMDIFSPNAQFSENTPEMSNEFVAIQPMPQNVNVTFRVHYLTQSPNQKVAVTGDHPELGNWKNFVSLVSDEDGNWSTAVSLPVESHVEWKFVVVEQGDVCRWEECGNRFLDTGCGENMNVFEWWGYL